MNHTRPLPRSRRRARVRAAARHRAARDDGFFLVIPAQDVSQSTTLGVTFYVIHMFRMSLFYFIAGFFAHLVFHRRGARAFVKDRAKRILVPMTAGWIVLAPPTIAAVIWGLTRTFPDGPPPGTEANGGLPQGFPLTHLWFLYYLSIFYVLALALRAPSSRSSTERRAARAHRRARRRGLASYLAPLVLAAPIFAVLYTTAAWPVWFGVPTPDTGFMPKIPAVVGFGTAFVFGWMLHRQAAALGVLEKQWLVNLALAVGLTTAVPRDRRPGAELGCAHRGRRRRRHARRVHGLLHGRDLVLDVRPGRRRDALLLAAEPAAPLSRRLVVLALSRATCRSCSACRRR